MTSARESSALLIDGPLSIYVYPGTALEILQALERLIPLVKVAALEAQKEHDSNGPQR